MADENEKKDEKIHPLKALAGGISGMVPGLVGTAIQTHINTRESQKAFDRQRKLMHEQFQLNQQAQRAAALNERRGLIDAGISPALVAKGNFSPAGASASGVPEASISQPDFSQLGLPFQLAMQNALNSAQVRGVKADADLKESQKESQDIANSRARDADSGVNENMLSHFKNLREMIVRNNGNPAEIDKKIAEIESGERNYTVGSLEMNKLFEDYRKEHAGNFPAYKDAEFAYKVAELKNKFPSISKALASMPVREARKIEADISKLYADAYDSQTHGLLNLKTSDEINARIQKVIEEIKSINQNREIQRLNSPHLLIKDEDYGKLATWLGMDVYEKGTGLLTMAIGRKYGADIGLDMLDAKTKKDKELMDYKADIDAEANTPPDKVESLHEEIRTPNGKIPVSIKTGERRTTFTPRRKSRRSGKRK